MAIKCPIGFDVNRLRELVHETYDRVAREPQGEFHFHRGKDYACEYLKYDREELGSLPESEFFELSSAVGLFDGKILERFDCFKNTSAEDKVSKDLYVHAVNFFATKL
ncbi:MAG: hypothetical protein HYW01_12200 [Deltaproteobacteria bacterium]|nr:hypothetical protein [Deltaproteobacteria bacterium]